MRVVMLMCVGFCFILTAVGIGAETGDPTIGAELEKAEGAPLVLELIRSDTSPPLREIVKADTPPRKGIKISRDPVGPPDVNKLPEDWQGTHGVRFSDHVLQTESGRAPMPAPGVNVQGLGLGFPAYDELHGVPPDTTGAAGRNYYLQWVNLDFAVFNKDGSVVDLTGNDFRAGNTLWSGFGGRCQNANDGDPIVAYDQFADRWVMTQFALSYAATGPHSQCVAVSATDDPFGSWHRYEYVWPDNLLNDYPKMGIWSDGYYFSVNQFACSSWNSCDWRGAAVAVMEREEMLQGNSAEVVYWNLGGIYGHLLPADIDGNTLPPDGAPGMFFAEHNAAVDRVNIWKAWMDWDDPESSVFGIDGVYPNASVTVAPHILSNDIDQPGTTNKLDAMSSRLMFRAPYRNFGTHESVVLVNTINRPAAQHWVEIRDPAGDTPVLYQEGIYTPDDNGRWMGSIAMDGVGNIGLGYSVSGDAVSPSIRVVGRNVDDPLGEMSYSEGEIQTGSGHQNPDNTGRNRWGDYSTMSIDPSDDCTFWYTQEYIAGTGSYIWRTKVAAFAFQECLDAIGPVIFEDDFESGDTSAWD